MTEKGCDFFQSGGGFFKRVDRVGLEHDTKRSVASKICVERDAMVNTVSVE